MNLIKRSTSAVLALLLLSLAFIALIPADATTSSAMTFDAETMYSARNPYSQPLNTFEAVVNFPSTMNQSTRGGIIFGNWGEANPVVNFEVHANGTPRLFIVDASGNVTDLNFGQINLYNGKDTHVAIVRDATNKKAYCYIDGELRQTLGCAYTSDIKVPAPLIFGGDLRSGNQQYFKGSIISAALYSTARSAEQIKNDYEGNTTDSTDVVASYKTDRLVNNVIPDLSGNGYDLHLNQTWFSEKEPITDFSYSFAVIGDTQVIANRYPLDFHKIYDYILDNLERKKIKFVLGLGDITDNDTDAEWAIAKENIFKLDGKVGYSLVRGNHDSATKFNSVFPYSKYSEIIGGSYDGTMINTWQELVVGKVKYLIFTLDYGASDSVLNWAAEAIEDHPDHNVIITTHAYLYRDGTTLDQGDVCPPATTGGYNNGDHMWDKLIKKYENIVLVISGHDPCDRVVMAQDEGDNGNVVTQLLVDPQGVDANMTATGMVALLHFSEDGKNVTVEYYSTIKEQYFMSSNQFSFALDVLDVADDETTTPPENEDKEENKEENKGENKNENKDENTSGDKTEQNSKPTEKPTEKATDAITAPIESTPTTTDEANEKSGCGSVIGTIALLPTIAFASVLFVKKKKKY